MAAIDVSIIYYIQMYVKNQILNGISFYCERSEAPSTVVYAHGSQ